MQWKRLMMVLCIAILAAWPATSSAEEEAFQYTFRAGDKYEYDFLQKQTIRMEGLGGEAAYEDPLMEDEDDGQDAGGETIVIASLKGVLGYHVQSVEDGHAKVAVSFSELKIEASDPMMPVADLQRMLLKVVFVMELNAQGKLFSFTVRNEPGGLGGDLMRGIKETVQQVMPTLPGRYPEVGSTWESSRTSKMALPENKEASVQTDFTLTYRGKRMAGDAELAVVGMNGKITIDCPANEDGVKPLHGTGRFTGELMFSSKLGRVVSINVRGAQHNKITVPVGDEMRTLNQSADLVIKMNLR